MLAWPNKTDLAAIFAVEAPPYVEVLVGERPVERLLVEPLDVHGLTLLPALARSGPGGVAVETTSTAETRLAELGSRFDAEIIVGAPVLSSAESIELCPVVDAVVIVFDPSNTTREQLSRTLELLERGRYAGARRRDVSRPERLVAMAARPEASPHDDFGAVSDSVSVHAGRRPPWWMPTRTPRQGGEG